LLEKSFKVVKNNQTKAVEKLQQKIRDVEKAKQDDADQYKNELLAEQEIRKKGNKIEINGVIITFIIILERCMLNMQMKKAKELYKSLTKNQL
jgi:hypothetical protein